MPFARVNGIQMYYELHGTGPPLLLIEGLGCGLWCWKPLLPALARHHTVIAYDNRGVGQTDQPDMPYSIPLLADDAAGLLRTLDVARADVLGHSMGGYIAQELALLYPELVGSVVLAASALSGQSATPEFQAAVAAVSGQPPAVALPALMDLVVAPGYWGTHPAELAWLLRERIAALPPPHAYAAQSAAAIAYNGRHRAGRIRQPVLVAGGLLDRVLPPLASRELAAAIPGARLSLFEDAGHYLFWEKTAEFVAVVHQFLGTAVRDRKADDGT